ncbi:metal-dependent transcriptional regulator [Emergencia sp.]|uniref:metal-dependent transcriptional regulator n=1 Tax=Emergencia sp. TaxID=1926557 RepID=UPI003AF11B76
MKIQQSAEDYFETIYILKKRNGSVRAIDIATELGFSKPTVSVAMKKFRENGFITVDNAGQIELTEDGRIIAEKTYDKHNVIAEALIALGVDRDTAFEDSCKIEHCLSDKSFSAIKSYLASIKK